MCPAKRKGGKTHGQLLLPTRSVMSELPYRRSPHHNSSTGYATVSTGLSSPPSSSHKKRRRNEQRRITVALYVVSLILVSLLLLILHLLRKISREIAANPDQKNYFQPDLLGVENVVLQAGSKDDGALHEASALVVSANETVTEFTQPTFELFTHGAPLCTDELGPSDVYVTLVTQVSEDRLWMLAEHCKRWSGNMSVAIFTDHSVDYVKENLVFGPKAGSTYDSCRDHTILFQTLTSENVPEGEYPINTLRNLAIRGVNTSHFLYIDMDFWLSSNAHEVFLDNFTRTELASDPKFAIVVPAFQIARQCRENQECHKDNIAAMPTDKSTMLHMVRKKKGSVFDPTNRGAHGSTVYSKWSKMEEGDMWDIPCVISNRYEPYVAVRHCRDLPPYQEAFTGYGKNKVTQIMQMRHTGYIFSQLGSVFAVHYPHLQSKNRAIWNEGRALRNKLSRQKKDIKNIDWSKYKRGQVDRVFVQFRTWLKEEVEETARTPMCTDAMDDDHRLWV